jgi:hypothetical protein
MGISCQSHAGTAASPVEPDRPSIAVAQLATDPAHIGTFMTSRQSVQKQDDGIPGLPSGWILFVKDQLVAAINRHFPQFFRQL